MKKTLDVLLHLYHRAVVKQHHEITPVVELLKHHFVMQLLQIQRYVAAPSRFHLCSLLVQL
jgi:hypothetical protein